MAGAKTEKRIMLEELFYKNEVLEQEVYKRLASSEKHKELKELLSKLSIKEERHINIWKKMLSEDSVKAIKPKHTWLRAGVYRLVRALFGPAFMIRFLERNESNGLRDYRRALEGRSLTAEEKRYTRSIIKDVVEHEQMLLDKVQAYSGSLKYIESIVFGLNDGIVEVLAAVAGLAAFTNSSIFVMIGGIVVAVAGVSSMTGGAYIASKSKVIVGKGIESSPTHEQEEPIKEAYYTGVFYFLGAILPIIPFVLGASGYTGILIAAVLSAIGLTIASVVIAVVGGTSISKRAGETLAISFAATFFTTAIGTLAKLYFNVY